MIKGLKDFLITGDTVSWQSLNHENQGSDN
jgi:hypothetical protein